MESSIEGSDISSAAAVLGDCFGQVAAGAVLTFIKGPSMVQVPVQDRLQLQLRSISDIATFSHTCIYIHTHADTPYT